MLILISDSLPGTVNLTNSCGSLCYFEIKMQIQSKAAAGTSLFLVFVCFLGFFF